MPVRLIPILCLLLLMAGRTTMYVGPRFGFFEPVSRPAPTVQLAEHTQTGFGVIGGLWFGMKISDRVSLLVVPGTGSQQFTSDRAGPFINNGVDVELGSYQRASLSLLDLPLYLYYAFARSCVGVVPDVSVGGWPYFDERPQASTADSWSVAVVVASGVKYALHEYALHDFDLAFPATSIGLTAGIMGYI